MRLLLLLSTATFASALPDLKDARRRLGSDQFEERKALTIEFWEAGPTAIPLLEKLARDPDPEIATRAGFVLKRLVMGLGPDAPDDLLQLATSAEQAPFAARTGRLGDLLEHPGGLPAALVFLERWVSDGNAPHDHRLALTGVFLEGLLEQRALWRKFLTHSFSNRTRSYLIGTLSRQETPFKQELIAILANHDLRNLHPSLISHFQSLPEETHLTLARLAIIRNDLALATETLTHGLARAKSPHLARAIAFLEQWADLPKVSYHGPWQKELELFRARAHQNHPETLRLASLLTGRSVLQYESRLLAGKLDPPDKKDAAFLAGAESLPVWHLAFGSPPEEPDIEALTSSVLIDGPVLARILTALGHPVEAAGRLTHEGQISPAVGLLWRTGHREQALDLARETLAGVDEDQKIRVRLAMASLFLEAGDRKKAAQFFEPLIARGLESEKTRRRAIPLALRIYPLEKTTTLESALTAGRPYERLRAVMPFLDFPPIVAGYWYEHFYDPKSQKSPAAVIQEVKRFLSNQLPEARQMISDKLAKSPLKSFSRNDPLYQNALFLGLPEALELAERLAWQHLNTTDLLSIVRSEEWPPASRRKALDSALAIAPTDPMLRCYDLRLNANGDPGTLTLLPLASPGLALRLASLTGKRETLATTARVASFSDPSTLRCLGILGKSRLETNEPIPASRLLLAGLVGEISIGTRTSASIQDSLDTLDHLFRARLQSATSEDEKNLWRSRLERLGLSPK